MIILFAIYTYECFAVLRRKTGEKRKARIFKRQTGYLFFIHFNASMLIFVHQKELRYLAFYLAQVVLLAILMFVYSKLYKKASRLVVNNMCMLLAVGFIILTRLDFDKAMRQFEIAVVAVIITLLVPFIIHKLKFFNKLTWIYAGIGLLMLGVVAVAGAVTYGAKLSFSFGGITIQPSEFIKIIFVFFVASMLYESTEFKQVVKATIVAVAHVGILVVSKDLGAALIFFVVYLMMLYVATRKIFYLLAGGGLGAAAALVCAKVFSHVQVRILAWKDPLSVYDGAGYQVSHSLFAIGSGGWFGMGLYEGMPEKIPVVDQDFVFSAISEELGGIFAICVIIVCCCCFLMFLNISMQIRDRFYKLIALGLGTVYGIQVFLTIGGVTKCIPSTGVTLPLVSYGGSSLLSTFIIFAIIQGLYILRQDEGVQHEKRKDAGRRKKKNVRETAGTKKDAKQPTRDETKRPEPDGRKRPKQDSAKRPKQDRRRRQPKGFENDFEDLD